MIHRWGYTPAVAGRADRRGGPRRGAPGVRAVQAARAARHAHRGREAVSGKAPFDDLNMSPQGVEYVRWFHEANVWKNMTWHGIRTLKLPSDIWNYQEIIFERKIDHVIETGTRHGGSAVFFAETLAARRARGPGGVDRRGPRLAPDLGVRWRAFPHRRQRCRGDGGPGAGALLPPRAVRSSSSSTPTTRATTCCASCAPGCRGSPPATTSWWRTRS